MSMGSLPAVNDPEGLFVPENMPGIIDAHVHLFPDPIFAAIWEWFDHFAWPIRYRMRSEEIIEFLCSRGIQRILALHYAHKPGIAQGLNTYMADICKRFPQAIGTATIFPGESGAADILEKAFDIGLQGVKLHAHVQYFDMNSKEMNQIYEICALYKKPLIMHVGREPKNPKFRYERDPYEICAANKLEKVLQDYPELKICVPHMGANEYAEYSRLLSQYDNLWLDTAMVYADYLPDNYPPNISDMRLDRVMFGTDFPNIPYAWDREIRRLQVMGIQEDKLSYFLNRNVMQFLGIQINSLVDK